MVLTKKSLQATLLLTPLLDTWPTMFEKPKDAPNSVRRLYDASGALRYGRGPGATQSHF